MLVSRYVNIGVRVIRRSLSTYPNHTVVGMPALSPTMATGTISAWNKKAGDSVSAGDSIAEVQTDKATMAFESQDDFIIAKLLIEAGAEVSVGVPILITVEDAKDVAAFANYSLTSAGSSSAAAVAVPAPAPAVTAAVAAPVAVASSSGPQLFMPSARHLVESKNLNTDKITGTAKGGRISKGDVISAIKSGVAIPGAGVHAHNATVAAVAAPVVAAPAKAAAAVAAPSQTPVVLVDPTGGKPINEKYKDIPNTNMRKIIAKRLTESKATVPHFYVSIECEVDELMALRKQLKKDFEVNVSVNDFVIRASALALRDVPEVNAKWDTKSQSRVAPGPVDVSVAVATPSGLITPILPATDKRGLDNISQKVKDLAKRAKDNKLKPEEFQGGSFTISNLGMFGISYFSAVVNPPQAAILAVGGGVPRVVPPKNPGDKPRTVTTVTVQLSADRRVVDEPIASQFLQAFRSYLSNPKTMLL